MDNEKALLEAFAKRYRIKTTQLGRHESLAAYWLEYSESLLIDAVRMKLDQLNQFPLWGITWRMIERSSRYGGSSLVLLALGHPGSGEVLARTVLESTINSLYIMHGNTPERLVAYLTDYIATERRQNKRWAAAITGLVDPVQIRAHRAGLARKEEGLRGQENAIASAAADLGIVHDPAAKWKTLRDRFIAVNHELSYDTVYAALCSQAHADAEDLLNELIVLSTNRPELETALKEETENFSRMLIYIALYFHLEAVVQFGDVHELNDLSADVTRGYAEIQEIAKYYAIATQKIL